MEKEQKDALEQIRLSVIELVKAHIVLNKSIGRVVKLLEEIEYNTRDGAT